MKNNHKIGSIVTIMINSKKEKCIVLDMDNENTVPKWHGKTQLITIQSRKLDFKNLKLVEYSSPIATKNNGNELFELITYNSDFSTIERIPTGGQTTVRTSYLKIT